MNKYLKGLLAGAMILGTLLLLGLALSTRGSEAFESQYPTLLVLNIIVIIVMIGLLGVLAYWLLGRFRRNVFGTRLLTRFALSFALLGIVPGVILFAISTLFVSRTIDTWFNLDLNRALEAGLTFGREHLSSVSEQSRSDVGRISLQLAQRNTISDSDAKEWLTRYQLERIVILNAVGAIVWQQSQTGENLVLPSPDYVNTASLDKSADGVTVIEDESDTVDGNDTSTAASPIIHVLYQIPNQSAESQTRYVYAQRVMPAAFSADVGAIQTGLRDYQATEASRNSLKNLYRVTLGVSLLLTVLAAVAAAFLIANRMIQPILWLAEATRKVAKGQYALVPQRVKGSDELIQLVDSFGDMASQLNTTQASLTANQKALESEKAYSEAVLDNLSAGVLVFDSHFVLEDHNQSASRIFNVPLTPFIGQHMANTTALASLYDAVFAAANHARSQSSHAPWRVQQNVVIERGHHEDEITLSIQGSRFTRADSDGYVLVIDDISPIISAQRTLAWGEVARRLAHEIKNPLTPIQLSAERLQHKLSEKLEESDQQLLERSTRTIVNQVGALQNLVNEFRDYARAPEVSFAPVSLNELITDILVLYESGQIGESPQYLIRVGLAQGLPDILADAQQLRQVFHNLIKNAIEAKNDQGLPIIDIQTRLVPLQSSGLLNQIGVNFSIKDNGVGFTGKALARMFEPYNTTKATGTGLGLPVVKKIIDAHHAKIVVKNCLKNETSNEILGAQIDILFLNVAQNETASLTPPLL
ncbi:two-component sensor histidine kinase [Formosimonas limnophila]|uniref:histidine kinase n=1 Tax=Formosimonas limnophila TaxID=1384487 RepID=A0A8J3CKR2_9BURK|nr:ATP-binding protein [Formosimonas limnophila]GHA72203.1 two-component sensor histidine kinase [Formosimonas limnophila]